MGIAADEAGRLKSLQEPTASYLNEYGLTSKAARELCESYGLLNPLYQYFSRIGCVRCPKQRETELFKVMKLEPEKWEWCKQVDELSPVKFKKTNRGGISFNAIAQKIESQMRSEVLWNP